MKIFFPQVKTKYLLAVVLLLGIFIFNTSDFLPSYTRLAIVFLILPFIFFTFRKEEHFDKKKYFLILVFSILATIFYDTVAQNVWLWRFPYESVSFWILGIPLEEYIFGFWFPSIVLGIYTSLPKRKVKRGIFDNIPHVSEPILFGIIFALQLITLYTFLSNPDSYFKWVLIFAILPSVFYFWRKREHIDKYNLLWTLLIMVGIVFLIDSIFIPANTWYYNDDSLIGRIFSIPIDDIIFSYFNTIFVIGIYTSLPNKKLFLGKE